MNWIQRLLGRAPASERASFDADLAPDAPFYVIGDVHGCQRLLDSLIARIEAEDAAPTIVCVGDYVDRGEDSADVLRRLQHLNTAFPDTFICLKGNHEAMCLAFLEDPETQGDRWLRNGGLQTLASFRVGRAQGDTMTTTRDRLAAAMGPELITWITALPLVWRSGNVAVVHAGASPAHPITEQREDVLLWGHPAFARVPRGDGIWVAHGHTIVDVPSAACGRIAVDTGAYATGRLTAARISGDGVRFIST